MDQRTERLEGREKAFQKIKEKIEKEILIFPLVLFLLCGSTCLPAGRGGISFGFEPVHMRNRNGPGTPLFQLPYRPLWVNRVKKGAIFKYKRKEFSSPLVSEGLLFVGTESRYFTAMKKVNGRRVWRFRTEGAVSSKPAVGRGKIFFGDDEGYFYALDLKTGKKIWSTRLDAEILTAPATGDDRIYVATVEGQIAALNEGDGTVVWENQHATRPLQMTIRGNSTPVLDPEGNLYVGFADGVFWSLSAKTGKILWERRLESTEKFRDLDGVPLVEKDRIYISNFDGPLVAMTKGGKVLWTVPLGSGLPFVSGGDVLYISDSHGSVVALQKKDGSTLWKTKVGEGALTAPVLYKNVIAVGLSSSTMNFLDAESGRLMFRRFAKKGISSDPFLDGDRLYYLSNGGRLYSLKMVDRSLP